jgi:GTP-dependent phosphoenolpyruvate carboxykinase
MLIAGSIVPVIYILIRLYPAKFRFSTACRKADPCASDRQSHPESGAVAVFLFHARHAGSGVEFIKSLRLSTGLIRNASLRESLETAAVQIREGKKIADSFHRYPFCRP